jgi:hypothetical protein
MRRPWVSSWALFFFLGAFVIFLLAPWGWAAFGPHDPNCVACHSPHVAKGASIWAMAPNTALINPATRKNITGIVSLCMACHDEAMKARIDLKRSHPVGLKPKRAKVPEEMLRQGALSCTSCHNPHPFNPYYKYLVVSTDGGRNMGKLCVLCHAAQAAPESKPRPAKAPPPSP